MHTSLRLLAIGWVAATAASALGQNSRYVGDLRSVDRELLRSAAVAPGASQQSFARGQAQQGPRAQAQGKQGAVKPRDQRKRTSLFGMLTSWAGKTGKDREESKPPAPAGAFAAETKPRSSSPKEQRAGGTPSNVTRWTKKENLGAPPVQTLGAVPALPTDSAVQQAGGGGLPLPIAHTSAPSTGLGPATETSPARKFNAKPSVDPASLRLPPQVPAEPTIVALANAPDPQATPLALKASPVEPPISDDEMTLDGVVFVTDNPSLDAPIEEYPSTEMPSIDSVAEEKGEETETTTEALEPSEDAVALEAPPAAALPEIELPENEPELVETPEPVEAVALAESPTAPVEEKLEAAEPGASEPDTTAPAIAAVAEALPADTEPAPELNHPTISAGAIATDVDDPSQRALLATERTSLPRQQPRLGLPPRRPAPPRQPSDRAKILLSEAHQLAQGAATTEEYTGIIQRCRYVLTFDKAPQAVAYAHELGAWSLNCRGETLMEEGRVEEAEADFYDALLTDTDCWRAEHNLGVVEMRRGDLEQARRRFDRTLELNPEFAKAFSNRAALAVQSGDFDSAMQDYERAIEADPDLAVAHTGRGRLCHMLGYLQLALRHLDAAALLSPDDAAIAIARGDLLVDFGRYGPARSAYEHAIKLNPDSPIAYRNLSWLQATCPVADFRDGEAALWNAERAAELSAEEDDISLDTYAAALAATGRFEEAAETQLRAAEMAPEADAEAYLDRMTLYLRGEAFTSRPIGGVVQAGYTE